MGFICTVLSYDRLANATAQRRRVFMSFIFASLISAGSAPMSHSWRRHCNQYGGRVESNDFESGCVEVNALVGISSRRIPVHGTR